MPILKFHYRLGLAMKTKRAEQGRVQALPGNIITLKEKRKNREFSHTFISQDNLYPFPCLRTCLSGYCRSHRVWIVVRPAVELGGESNSRWNFGGDDFFCCFLFFLGEPGKEAGMEEGKGELGGKKEENQRDPGG